MARIAGIDLPREKRIEIALTYIYGIGRTSATKILAEAGINPDIRVKDLTEEDEIKLSKVIADKYVVEGDLAVHKVAPDETLTRIALKYYGSKKLWPYLVLHNRLARPDDLRRGMEISIPMLVPSK